MTREKAIEVLKTYDMSDDNEDTEFKEALALAISSLKHYKGAYIQQLRAERDIAIEQLEKLGYSLGEVIESSVDAISRQAAIEALNCEINGNIESDIDLTQYKRELQEFANMILSAQGKALRDLPPVATTRKWIPCSERLPEENKDVLIDIKEGEEHTFFVTRLVDVTYWIHLGRDVNVVAWMPLPDPYKTERRER